MLDFAINVAKKTGLHALKYFEKSAKVTFKADNSPVTRADREAELIARDLIGRKFPSHGIIGEEFKAVNAGSKYTWVIDPVDGTKSFVRGIKGWGTLLALLENKRPIIGIYYSPANNEIFYCQKEKGTFFNGKKVRLSKINDIKKSFFVHSSINHFVKWDKVDKIVKLAELAQGKRGASDCDGINMLLKGQADFNISGRGSIWDYAAPAILTEEAGGKFTDINGKYSLTSETAVFSNGLLHNQVLNILKS